MKIKFCGAAQTVTGSQHLLEIAGKKILLDCGLYQGKREEAYDINKNFLFDPKEIHCVVLSHAHIDHSGNLPMLSAKGFDGSIYTTTSSCDLCSIMLQDSGHIQEKDIEYVNRKRKQKGEPEFHPLYTTKDVLEVMTKFKTINYHKKFFIDGLGDKVCVEYYDAGHILGSGMVVLEIKDGNTPMRFGFTGDLGRPGLPILRDPEFIGNVDYIISESTYGGRVHDNPKDMDNQLATVLKEAIGRGGKIIIPAFSVGRTQEIVYSLSKLFESEIIPKIPIFIDSPLSVNVTDIFKIHTECFDKDTAQLISDGVDIFGFSNLTYIKDVEESKRLNDFKGCCVIISASGMCEAGRVLHHLKNNIEDKRSTVLIVGFCAEHTLGRRLVESKDMTDATVKIFGDEFNVRAKIYVLNSFSAHADMNELNAYFEKFDRNMLKGIFLVHGDIDQQEIFKASLKGKGFKYVNNPAKGEELEI